MKRQIVIIVLILLAITAVVPSCKGRIRDRIAEEREARQEESGTEGVAEEKPIDLTFSYDADAPLNAELKDYTPVRPIEKLLLKDVYKLSSLSFDSESERVPCLYAVPSTGDGPFPVVVMIHGHNSSKFYMVMRYSALLAAKGIASVALDLPLQGERKADMQSYFTRFPATTAKNFEHSVIDTLRLVDWVDSNEELDGSSIAIMGYSLGSWISVMAAANDQRLKTVALNVIGEGKPVGIAGSWEYLEDFEPVVNRYEAIGLSEADETRFGKAPIERWMEKIPPRPVLMLNGEKDKVVDPEGTKRLYEAAGGPKEIKWYDSGHILPDQAMVDCVNWLAEHM